MKNIRRIFASFMFSNLLVPSASGCVGSTLIRSTWLSLGRLRYCFCRYTVHIDTRIRLQFPNHYQRRAVPWSVAIVAVCMATGRQVQLPPPYVFRLHFRGLFSIVLKYKNCHYDTKIGSSNCTCCTWIAAVIGSYFSCTYVFHSAKFCTHHLTHQELPYL